MKRILLGVMALFLFYNNSHADNSISHERAQQLVTEIYVATFERAPAYAGLMYWTNEIETGHLTIEQVAQSFFDQPETQAKFPQGSSNTEFIETIFYNTLSRAPAAAGLAYWVDALDSGSVRRDQAIMAVINGAKAETGSPADAAMLAKKTEIGLLFANSEMGTSNTHEDFMDWASEIIMFATSSDFTIEKAEEYIADFPSALEDEIDYYMALVSSAGDLTPMVSEISTVLTAIMSGDTSIVTISPPLETLDIYNLPAAITIALNFGAGYTPADSSSIYTGQAVLNITDIAFSSSIAANVALTATNIKRDGQLVLNGGMTLNISALPSGSNIAVSATVNFSNLQSLDFSVNGGAGLNMVAGSDLTVSQPITLTLNQLTTQDEQISGTVTLTPYGTDAYDALLNLTTTQGNVAGTVRLAYADETQITVSTPGSSLMVGEYSVDINDAVMDSTLCSETPISGNIVVSGNAETKTITFSNCTYTVN